MKEENIDNRIERIIESVGSKKAAMRQWESERITEEVKRKIAVKKWRTYGISAAASIVVVCGIGFGIYFNRTVDGDFGVSSSTPLYRGGSCDISEIQSMIDSAYYDKALQAIDVTLADTLINASFTEERKDYLRNLNANREYELVWLKIDVLVKCEKKADAISLLKEYVNADGVHQEEAEQLLHKLTR